MLMRVSQVHRADRDERRGFLLPVEEPQYASTGEFNNYFAAILINCVSGESKDIQSRVPYGECRGDKD